MRIGEVAGMAGVNIQTLRYYERLGLLQEPQRRNSGYREYPAHTVAEVCFIKRAQDLGFSLKEIEELIQLRKLGGNVCVSVHASALDKIRVIEEKIQNLATLKASLEELVASCVPSPATGECAAIEELLPTSPSLAERANGYRPSQQARRHSPRPGKRAARTRG